MKLDGLELWLDPVARSGPESMAVDEWLLGLGRPILRVYRWQGEWGTLGYFDSLSQAQASFPEIQQWVRRWTGGGTVDHRHDWPYTLLIPSVGSDQRLGGAESYLLIHKALLDALEPEALDARLCGGDKQTGDATCFDNPVTHDLVNGTGKKIAGAGQKRTKAGLLHQGSVALPLDGMASEKRAKRMADALSQKKWAAFNEEPPASALRQLQLRYEDADWLGKRP